jgi:small conductance mechanosensitive channel
MKSVLFLIAALATSAPLTAPYVTAPVTLDGATLFHIAAPASPQPGQVPIAARQLAVETALSQIVAIAGVPPHHHTLYDPQTLKVQVVPVKDQAVVEANDAHHSTPLSIVTATPIDAKYFGMTVTSIAYRWQSVLQDNLVEALRKRQPGVERQNTVRVGIAAGVLAVLTVLAWAFVIVPVKRRVRRIEQRIEQRGAQLEHPNTAPAAQSTNHQRRRRFLALALRTKDPERQLGVLRAIAATLVWVLVVVWFGVLVWAFFLFPQTTPLAHQVLQTLLMVAAIWIGAGLINRLLDLAIARIAIVWRRRHFPSAEERAREMLRIPTFTRAISGFKTVVLIFVALLITLGEIGVPVWSVVTFGGLTAIGITLAAQNFVRDFVNGFLVLLEDQYVVGDYITINAQSGIVETLTLRMVQMRDSGGNLVTVPHSAVTVVINHSRNWSRVDYRVSIDPGADTAKAMQLTRRAIEDVAHQEKWRGVVLEPLEWIGVESLSRDGVIVRASMKTAPLRQFELRRAINARVRELFAKEGIALGAPVSEPVVY